MRLNYKGKNEAKLKGGKVRLNYNGKSEAKLHREKCG